MKYEYSKPIVECASLTAREQVRILCLEGFCVEWLVEYRIRHIAAARVTIKVVGPKAMWEETSAHGDNTHNPVGIWVDILERNSRIIPIRQVTTVLRSKDLVVQQVIVISWTLQLGQTVGIWFVSKATRSGLRIHANIHTRLFVLIPSTVVIDGRNRGDGESQDDRREVHLDEQRYDII
jgi:hypothetical protein